jgi:hypothetical protein
MLSLDPSGGLELLLLGCLLLLGGKRIGRLRWSWCCCFEFRFPRLGTGLPTIHQH